MGGYAGGEIAAEIAAGSICHSFGAEARPVLADPAGFLENAILRAHDAIRGYAETRNLPEVPRTVVVACVIQQGRAWWNHVGDARLYLLRDGRIEACTRDHTAVQARVDAGEITPDEAYRQPDSIQVLQSLGAPTPPRPGPGNDALLQQNDILLLCSDGFWGPLRSAQLAAGASGTSLRRAILELSDMAERSAGAHADNLTVLALRWEDPTVPAASENPGASGG